jgi:hypothetical protein
MSLDKAIASGKEHRKPYRRSGRFDRTCRPHGSCPYCKHNRFVGVRREEEKALDDINELLDEGIIREDAIDIHPITKDLRK